MNGPGLPPAGLCHGHLGVPWDPATGRTNRMGRIHRIREQHHLIGLQMVPRSLVFLAEGGLDEGGLFVRIELARNRFRLAVLHARPVRQRDQPGPALILNGAFPLDPCPDLARRPRQRLGDPGFQFVQLFDAQAACAAFVAEARQAFDALFLIWAMPGADGVVVQQQVGDPGAARDIVRLYHLRWRIGDVFHALKSDCMCLEATQMHGAGRLFKLAVVGLASVCRTPASPSFPF
jgi:hypothetical protein